MRNSKEEEIERLNIKKSALAALASLSKQIESDCVYLESFSIKNDFDEIMKQGTKTIKSNGKFTMSLNFQEKD